MCSKHRSIGDFFITNDIKGYNLHNVHATEDYDINHVLKSFAEYLSN